MPSSATSSLRLQKMATGEKLNTWGSELNDSVFEMIEDAIAGWQSHTITGNKTLSSTNYVADEARMAMLNLTGTPGAGFTITIPAVPKWYWIRNATGQIATISAGGTTAAIQNGEVWAVLCDGTDVYRVAPTKFSSALDMTSNKITSLATPTADYDASTKKYVDDADAALLSNVSAAQTAAEAAQTAAEAAQTAAEAAQTAAETAYDSFDDRYLGAKASDPTVDNDGNALLTGAIYWNTASSVFKVWTGAAWQTLYTGNMSAQNANAVAITGGTITGLTSLSVSGNITVTGTVDGRDVATDGSKLDGIEAGAQVNDVISVAGRTGAVTLSTSDISGLGTIATQSAASVAITGGSITGITDLAVADGGTGASTASAARTNLGLEIGVNVQAYDAGLASIAGLTTAADRMIYTTASDTYAVATLTSAGRALLDDADASAQRTTLGLGSIATQAASSVAITGGAIDGTAIGGTTPAAGAFTTLTASDDVNFDSGTFFVDASANAVGIGTTSPSHKLSVVGGSAGSTTLLQSIASPRAYLNTADGILLGFVASNGTLGSHDFGAIFAGNNTAVSDGGAAVMELRLGGAATTAGEGGATTFLAARALNSTTVSEVALSTAGTKRLLVDASGNVGIGTTSPGGRLHAETSASGIIAAFKTNDGGSNNNTLSFVPPYGNGVVAANGMYLDLATAGMLGFRATATGIANLAIDSSGQVLIGTISSGASVLRVVGLPTSSAGLSTGDLWNDSGTLKVA